MFKLKNSAAPTLCCKFWVCTINYNFYFFFIAEAYTVLKLTAMPFLKDLLDKTGVQYTNCGPTIPVNDPHFQLLHPWWLLESIQDGVALHPKANWVLP